MPLCNKLQHLPDLNENVGTVLILTSRLKIAIDLSIILLLFYGTIFHLIYARLFITALFLFQTRLCLIFQRLFFLRSWKPISFKYWYLLYWPSFVFSSHTHFAIIHRHIIHANFYVIWLVSIYEWVVNNLFNFFRHYKSPPFHSVIRIHRISLSYHILVILPSHFSSMEQMLMLMLILNRMWLNAYCPSKKLIPVGIISINIIIGCGCWSNNKMNKQRQCTGSMQEIISKRENNVNRWMCSDVGEADLMRPRTSPRQKWRDRGVQDNRNPDQG